MPFQKGNSLWALRDNLLAGKTCEVPDCLSPAYCKNKCSKHYHRFQKHGDVNKVLPKFWSTKKITDPVVLLNSGCHVIPGVNGRPKKRIGASVINRSREVLENKLGRPLLPGMFACHTCDYPPCINPDHLWEGTMQDNIADRDRKRRHWAHRRKDAQLC
jgi:hypothetical protein